MIIPYQEKLGNYNSSCVRSTGLIIIPYQEKLGNYNNIMIIYPEKQIIPYQEKLGNYNGHVRLLRLRLIIPYQEKLGNYNSSWTAVVIAQIIPYQEKSAPSPQSRRADIWCAEIHFPCVLSIPYFSFLCKETSPDRFSAGLFFCIAIRFQTSCWIKFCFPALRNSVHFHPVVDL